MFDGLAGLLNDELWPGYKDGSGIDPDLLSQFGLLEEALATEPAELGYEFTVWTLDRLMQHLYEKTGIRLSDRTMSNTLKRLGYVYRRPKRDLSHLQDPEGMARAMAQLDELKKRHQPAPLSSSLWTKRR